jgi:hypothetical protein
LHGGAGDTYGVEFQPAHFWDESASMGKKGTGTNFAKAAKFKPVPFLRTGKKVTSS